jgi:hypothetical protein
LIHLLIVSLLAADPVVIEGSVPDDGTFFTVPIEVPAGTAELEIRHDDLSSANILDWGLFAPDGGYVGWGGGNSEPAVINGDASSRSYRPTELTPGTWRVLVGKALVTQKPAKYRIEVETRLSPTLTPQPERRPYVPAIPLEINARYYAGDLHVHSLESGDARPSISEITDFARTRGLDFVAFSEHNTLSGLDFFVDAQARSRSVLLVPSVEYTTYAGHMNVFGVSRLPPFWLGLEGATFEGAVADFAAQGAVPTINHPTLDLGTFCIGCAWQQPIVEGLGAVEVGVGGWDETGSLFDESALVFWEALADRGVHLAAVGGSDDHRAGRGLNQTQSAIGSPTTMIFAEELSVSALVRGLKEGRTVVKLRGPEDPMIEVRTLGSLPRAGDTLVGSSVEVEATVLGGSGHVLVWIENGLVAREEKVTADSFVSQFTLNAPSGKAARVRAELRVAQQPRTVTSHVWLAESPGLPSVAATKPMSCGVAMGAPLIVLVLLLRRRRAAPRPGPLPAGAGRVRT